MFCRRIKKKSRPKLSPSPSGSPSMSVLLAANYTPKKRRRNVLLGFAPLTVSEFSNGTGSAGLAESCCFNLAKTILARIRKPAIRGAHPAYARYPASDLTIQTVDSGQ